MAVKKKTSRPQQRVAKKAHAKTTTPKARPRSTRVRAQAAAPERPTQEALAAFMGVPLKKPLTGAQAQRLLKPLPGYRAIMDNVAENLRMDARVLELKYDPDDVLSHLARAKDLSTRVDVMEAVTSGADGERQGEDSQLMKVLLDCVRRVNEELATHPELLDRWKDILEFVKKNRPGPTGGSRGGTPPPSSAPAA
jgi:hypothetical protein